MVKENTPVEQSILKKTVDSYRFILKIITLEEDLNALLWIYESYVRSKLNYSMNRALYNPINYIELWENYRNISFKLFNIITFSKIYHDHFENLLKTYPGWTNIKKNSSYELIISLRNYITKNKHLNFFLSRDSRWDEGRKWLNYFHEIFLTKTEINKLKLSAANKKKLRYIKGGKYPLEKALNSFIEVTIRKHKKFIKFIQHDIESNVEVVSNFLATHLRKAAKNITISTEADYKMNISEDILIYLNELNFNSRNLKSINRYFLENRTTINELYDS